VSTKSGQHPSPPSLSLGPLASLARLAAERPTVRRPSERVPKMLKGVLGAITLLPWIYLAALLGSLSSPSAYAWLLGRRHVMMWLLAALWVGYMTHSVLSSRVPNDQRLHWLMRLLFLNFTIFPFYFFRFIWRPADAAAA
jgi:hypothetical protein